jgi:hypothetical protein
MTPMTDRHDRPPPADVLDVVQRHLATAAPPFDWEGHLATYSADALLPVGTAVVHRAGVSPIAYADHWRQTMADRPVGQTAPFTLVSVLDWQPDEAGGRLAAVVGDPAGRPWTTAWLLDGALVRAVCLHTGPLPSRERLLAQACGELVQWGANTAGSRRFLSPLGIGHHLRTHVDPLPLISLPEARFTCQDRGDCCQISRWDVPVSANAAVALMAVPWRDLQAEPVAVGRTEQYWRLAAADDGACHAQTDGSCSIHRTLGWQPIPICRVFPFQFTVTPDGIAVTASFTCLTVGSNQGAPLLERADDLQDRLRLGRAAMDAIPAAVPVWSGGPVMAWETYKGLETLLLDTLADRTLGDLPARVLACSRGMAALLDAVRSARGCPNDPVALCRDGMAGTRLGTPAAADMLMGRLLRDRPWAPVAVRPFGGWLRTHWQISRAGALGPDRDDELATRYLRTVLFRKPGLGVAGIAFTWGVTAWIAALYDRQTLYQSRRDRVAADRTLQLDTARRLDHLLLNADITELLESESPLRQLISNPATWLSFSSLAG